MFGFRMSGHSKRERLQGGIYSKTSHILNTQLPGNELAASKYCCIVRHLFSQVESNACFHSEVSMPQSNSGELLPSIRCASNPPNRDGAARSSAPLWTALGATLLLSACTAPGMKMDMKASSHPTTTKVDGLNVNLLPLNTEVLNAQAPRSLEAASFSELLADKFQPYRVGPQDVLLVTVWDHPEITLPLGQFRSDAATGMVVDEDGSLYFPYVGKIAVTGLTISQVRDALTSSLAKVLQKPQVDVKMLSFRSQKVYVGGEVKSPAVYNVTDVPFTLTEAVNRAGGFLPTANDSQMLLTRGTQSWKLDFRTLMASGNRIGQIILKDGDSLYVPNSQEEPVYLMGELARPGTLPLSHGNLSLAQAISDVGGVLATSADASSIYVIRQASAANSVDVYHLDARNPTAMVLADRFRLNPRDIVYVDAGSLVRFSRVMSLVLPTFSAITTTAITAAEIRYLRRP